MGNKGISDHLGKALASSQNRFQANVWSLKTKQAKQMGAQWLSGRVLDSRPKGRGFEPHWRHCVVSLSKNINPSLELVQPRKTCPFIIERLLMELKESNQTKQTKHSKCCNFLNFLREIKDQVFTI